LSRPSAAARYSNTRPAVSRAAAIHHRCCLSLGANERGARPTVTERVERPLEGHKGLRRARTAERALEGRCGAGKWQADLLVLCFLFRPLNRVGRALFGALLRICL
jgi:hypothetical protein